MFPLLSVMAGSSIQILPPQRQVGGCLEQMGWPRSPGSCRRRRATSWPSPCTRCYVDKHAVSGLVLGASAVVVEPDAAYQQVPAHRPIVDLQPVIAAGTLRSVAPVMVPPMMSLPCSVIARMMPVVMFRR